MPSQKYVVCLMHFAPSTSKTTQILKKQPKKQQSTNFKCYSNFIDNNWFTYINLLNPIFAGVLVQDKVTKKAI
jgi:hypothetical protein